MPDPGPTRDAHNPPDPAQPAEQWEGCTSRELASLWALPAVRIYSTVGSSNDVARVAAEEGAPAGTLVIAERQMSGRGRVGRTWSSPAGLGLYLSFVAEPSGRELATLPLRVGVAVAQALEPWAGGETRIKWPNDLLLRGRKLGGILCEAGWESGRAQHVVVGIGLNILQQREDFPPEVREQAASLRECADRISRFDVATAVVREISSLILPAAAASDSGWLEILADRDALRGRSVNVTEPESGRLLVTGIAAGISPDGSLLVQTHDSLASVRSGTVRLL